MPDPIPNDPKHPKPKGRNASDEADDVLSEDLTQESQEEEN